MSFIRTLFRALAIALVCAWIMFFAGVFLSLIIMVTVSAITKSHPDMTISYRIVGLTAGGTAFVLGFAGSLLYDFRKLARSTPS
jgi:hypothetical protein